METKKRSNLWLWLVGAVLLGVLGCCGAWVALFGWAANEGAEIQRREAAAERRRVDRLRSAAPTRISAARAHIEAARAALAATRYAEAVEHTDQARYEVRELAPLQPPVEGFAEVESAAEEIAASARQAESAAREEAERAAAEARHVQAIGESIEQAESVIAESPGDNVVAYDGRLEVLERTLASASATAREQHGAELDRRVAALGRRRASIRSQVERARREALQREIYARLCGGDPPQLSPWDGALLGAEQAIAETAHDPDSIDVERCTVPVLTPDDCWTTICQVRGRNAFGALILHRYRFSVGANNTIINFRRL